MGTAWRSKVARAGAILVLIVACWTIVVAQQIPKPKIRFQNASPCLTIVASSPSVGIVKNACAKALQFTIHWSGTKPPQDKVYRIGPTESRQVSMLDANGVVTAENAPSFGIGPKGSVTFVKKPTNVQNLEIVFSHNEHEMYGLVKVVFHVFLKPPATDNGQKYFVSTHLFVVHPSSLGDQNIMYFLPDLWDHYEIFSLQSEDDPQ